MKYVKLKQSDTIALQPFIFIPAEGKQKRQMTPSKTYSRIYHQVRIIPRGKVATYGTIARLSGIPRCARQVGYALHVLSEKTAIPWHRVVNAGGGISLHKNSDGYFIQKALLESEGIVFDTNDRIDLKRYGWNHIKIPVETGFPSV